ncbi:MAG: hypothetical protein IPM25_06725 [Chloracidobacterium sp.]|nr:hypothetical protein [Chloracidobacterium sp.]
MKHSVILAIAFVIFISACGNQPQRLDTDKSAPRPEDQATNNQTPPDGPADQSGSITKPTLDDEIGNIADSAGTAGVTEKKNPNINAVAIMSDVRTARHANYDRMVFEFLGPNMPTYHIEYIDKPVRSCGSGDVVSLAGDGWLEVRFTDAQAHAPEGDATIKDRQRSPNLPIVKDLKITCDFEAEVTWVAGVASPNRYRVIELKNPTRLAIDIRH